MPQGQIQDLKKRGGTGASPQEFFGQLGVLFKKIGAKRGGRAPPPPSLWSRVSGLPIWVYDR